MTIEFPQPTGNYAQDCLAGEEFATALIDRAQAKLDPAPLHFAILHLDQAKDGVKVGFAQALALEIVQV